MHPVDSCKIGVQLLVTAFIPIGSKEEIIVVFPPNSKPPDPPTPVLVVSFYKLILRKHRELIAGLIIESTATYLHDMVVSDVLD
jgi:hypothetical protein